MSAAQPGQPIYPVAPSTSGSRPDAGFPATGSLSEARAFVSDRLDDGLTCPCCDQHAQVYRRRINRGQAESLIRLYALCAQSPNGWVHVSVLGARSREEGKLAHWGLVEEGSLKPDGGRGGYWRITSLGRRFVRGEALVPKYVWMYNARPVKFSTDERVSIHDVINDPFRLSELLSRR